ncbi:hypothetical protein Q8A67_020381 [Cirrhinus molitorella]|uniref:Uncharacterized protein n=1 Tax=Cirrhinus molitorella TaxID=172907 RepID=A0AA88PA76_9TELE|nr:hypothetical protein Q8A67_020381 [Cirrhinus molitorella]
MSNDPLYPAPRRAVDLRDNHRNRGSPLSITLSKHIHNHTYTYTHTQRLAPPSFLKSPDPETFPSNEFYPATGEEKKQLEGVCGPVSTGLQRRARCINPANLSPTLSTKGDYSAGIAFGSAVTQPLIRAPLRSSIASQTTGNPDGPGAIGSDRTHHAPDVNWLLSLS